jgi:hypothetical protein
MVAVVAQEQELQSIRLVIRVDSGKRRQGANNEER